LFLQKQIKDIIILFSSHLTSIDAATAPHAGAGDEGIGGMVANAQKHSIKLVVPTAPEYTYTSLTARRISAGSQNDFSKKMIERSQSAPVKCSCCLLFGAEESASGCIELRNSMASVGGII
jgi:hypothetical protein